MKLCSRSFSARLALTFLACTAFVLSTRADDWAPNLTTAATWNSNVSNANVSSDEIDSLLLNADMVAAQRYEFGRYDSFHPTIHLAGDWWPRYSGLTTGAAGLRAEWRHKFGVGALAPTFSVGGTVDYIAAKETGRRGVTTRISATLRKRLNDLTRATLSHEFTRHDARYAVFDRAASETTFEIDRDLTDVTRLTLGVRYRDGDIVSYATPPRPDLVAIAPNRLAVDTFDRSMIAYSVDAVTWSARAAVTRALDQNSAVIVSYEWRDTERAPLHYTNHLVSIALVHQF